MSMEKSIIVSLVVIATVGILSFFGTTISWGFTTLADCFAESFDSSCYSKSDNEQVDVDDPMWWPSKE